jgi:hypothetical protein
MASLDSSGESLTDGCWLVFYLMKRFHYCNVWHLLKVRFMVFVIPAHAGQKREAR